MNDVIQTEKINKQMNSGIDAEDTNTEKFPNVKQQFSTSIFEQNRERCTIYVEPNKFQSYLVSMHCGKREI